MILSLEDLIINHKNKTYKISVTFGSGSIILLDSPDKDVSTIFLKMIAGIIKTNGKVIKETFHQNPVLNQVSYIGRELAVKLNEAVINNIAFWSKLAGSFQMLNAGIHYFGLADLVDVECSQLSREQVKKVALSRLLSCYADLWLLDCPDQDLSKSTKERLVNAITVRAQEMGIVIVAPFDKLEIPAAINFNLSEFI